VRAGLLLGLARQQVLGKKRGIVAELSMERGGHW